MEKEFNSDTPDIMDLGIDSETDVTEEVLPENVKFSIDEDFLKNISEIVEKQIAEAFQKRLNGNIPKKSKKQETDAFVAGLFRK